MGKGTGVTAKATAVECFFFIMISVRFHVGKVIKCMIVVSC